MCANIRRLSGLSAHDGGLLHSLLPSLEVIT